MYFGSDPWSDSIYYGNDPSCTPDDGIVQQIKVTNITLWSPLNSHEFKYIHSMSFVLDDLGKSRPFVIILDNINVENIHN